MTKAQVRRMIENSNEKCVFLRILGEQSLSSAATCVVVELSRISQGDTRENRGGDKIVGIGLTWKLLINNTAAVPVGVRVIVIDAIADKYAAIGDDFTNNGTSDGPFVTETIEDLTHPLTNGFKVLYDELFCIAGLGDATALEQAYATQVHKFRHPRNFEIGDLATSDQSVTHNLRMILLARSLDADGTASVVEWTLGSEYFFRDV